VVRRDDKGWIATFDGWSILRHLRMADTPVPARFELRTGDGQVVVAEAMPSWQKGE
jgi:hypothetical protein